MRASNRRFEAALLIVVLVSTGATISAEDKPPVAFPEGYRSWQHVKSIVVGPEHASFPRRGGIHHYYANDLALVGYETGKFPNGSIIVDETVFAKDGEGPSKGILMENERRLLEMMIKDEHAYGATGGWGFERFVGDDKTGRLTVSEQRQCQECHAKAKDRDQVFSKVRP